MLLCAQPNCPPTLGIGLLLPADQGEAESLRQGATLGVEHANQSAGVQARLVSRGRPGQWGTDGEEAAALTLDEAVAGIITPSDGSAAHQVLQVAGRTRVPVVSLCSDSSITRAGLPWAIRIVPRTEEEACTLLKGLLTSGKASPPRCAALVPQGRSGREAARDLLAAAAIVSCELQEPVPALPLDKGGREQLDRLLRTRPQAILLWLDASLAADFTRAARKAGFAGCLMIPSRICSEPFLKAAGLEAAGVRTAALASNPGAEMRLSEFQREYRHRFGAAPDPLAIAAHDAALLLTRILREDNGEPWRAFPVTGDFSGISGPLRFDASGNRIMTLTLLTCRDGEFRAPVQSHLTQESYEP